MKDEKDISGLYEASGLKEIFEKADKLKGEQKQKTENSFWKDIENEKDIFDEPKLEIKKEDEGIDPFWLT